MEFFGIKSRDQLWAKLLSKETKYNKTDMSSVWPSNKFNLIESLKLNKYSFPLFSYIRKGVTQITNQLMSTHVIAAMYGSYHQL